MSVEGQIRDAAKRGCSKQQVREMLGVSRGRFELMLEAMEPVEWAGRGRTAESVRSREERRGMCSEAHRAALAKGNAVRRLRHLHTVDGVEGTVRELAKHFGINRGTVHTRMRAGMTISQAIKTPVTPRHLTGKRLVPVTAPPPHHRDAEGPAFDIEHFITESAANGLSKTQVRESLGMCREKFGNLLEVMPPLQWPGPGKSLGHKLGNEARRGQCSPALHKALKQAHAAKTAKATHTVNGITGTIAVLAKHFGVGDSTVRRRIKEGMSLEQALTTPPTPFALRHKAFNKREQAA